MIVTFLALLEMIRLKLVRVFQRARSGRSASTSARARPTRPSRSAIRKPGTRTIIDFSGDPSTPPEAG